MRFLNDSRVPAQPDEDAKAHKDSLDISFLVGNVYIRISQWCGNWQKKKIENKTLGKYFASQPTLEYDYPVVIQ